MRVAIAVDHQPGEPLGDEGRAQALTEQDTELRDPDINGDMALQFLAGKSKFIQAGRNFAAGVIADQHKRRIGA